MRDILRALGAQATGASWIVAHVMAYGEALDATGEGGRRLEELAASGTWVDGMTLKHIAEDVQQTIWGEFRAYLDPSKPEPLAVIRAIDSSFFEVESADPRIIRCLKGAFKDARTVDRPATPPYQIALEPGRR